MGGSVAQTQQPQTSGGGKGQAPSSQASQPAIQSNWGQSQGKGMAGQVNDIAQPTQQAPQPMGKGGAQTNSATSGQPTMGTPNQYSNTVGQWDNTQQQPVQQHGKGKGA